MLRELRLRAAGAAAGFREALLLQAVFFTSFLHEMAFVGWGPVVIFCFALIQGFTYHRTRSLL